MKLVAKTEPKLTTDPKPLDRGTWNRVKGLIDLEAIHREWGCALYSLHRLGRINNDQREAGDRYAALARDWSDLWRDNSNEVYFERSQDSGSWIKNPDSKVPAAMGHVAARSNDPDDSEFTTKRAQRLSKRYREAREIAGAARRELEELLLEDIWPVGERGHIEISHALTRLVYFFNTGTKRKR
jgi:hypothetical protein